MLLPCDKIALKGGDTMEKKKDPVILIVDDEKSLLDHLDRY